MRILTDDQDGAAKAPHPGLRHGVPGVGVSTLASQWYCELKIDLKYRHPELSIVSPAMERGTEGHGAFSADAVPMSREELEARLRDGEDVYLQESRFRAPIHDAPVVGIPDLVHLRGREARLVLEFKFSRRDDLFIDRFIQAQTYGLLLEGSGYGMNEAVCVVGVLKSPASRGADESKMESLRKDGVLGTILERSAALRERLLGSPRHLFSLRTTEERSGTLHAFRYDPATARRHLRWALDYWLERREAVPTKHASKCRSCAFNAAGLCGKARCGPDPRISVQPVILDGRPMLEVRWQESL
ncbi:MAG TPA: hypothetical protein VNM14_02155 [Planctomycetota bacterium]|nr:hypothetical protein [Planctomycetota bacterium]